MQWYTISHINYTRNYSWPSQLFCFITFSYDEIGIDECLVLVQKLAEQIQFFAKKCKKKAPASCLTLQELTSYQISVEMFVNSLRSSKICKWLMLEGNFEFQTRRTGKIEVLINAASHVPQRFKDR
jgi:hypothetical protein